MRTTLFRAATWRSRPVHGYPPVDRMTASPTDKTASSDSERYCRSAEISATSSWPAVSFACPVATSLRRQHHPVSGFHAGKHERQVQRGRSTVESHGMAEVMLA